jgi:hypothetical protein
MKIITKKRVTVSVALLSLVALLVWYFSPVLMANWFMFHNTLIIRYLNIRPTYIEKLPETPKDWTPLSIGDLGLTLPMSRYDKISGKETYLNLYARSGSLAFFDIAPQKDLIALIEKGKMKYPYISYEEQLAIVKTLPSDISIFNSRKENEQESSNLILKAISMPVGGFAEVRILNSKVLKAICLISGRRKRGFSASVDLYSPNDRRAFNMLLINYKNKDQLTSDLLKLLSGITLPDQPPDPEKVSKDIDTIVNTYKKTEHQVPFDRK